LKKFNDLDPESIKKIRATLVENYSKILKDNLKNTLEKDFLDQENFLNTLSIQNCNIAESIHQPDLQYILSPEANFKPELSLDRSHLLIPIQENFILKTGETRILDFGIQFYIPELYCTAQFSVKMNIPRCLQFLNILA